MTLLVKVLICDRRVEDSCCNKFIIFVAIPIFTSTFESFVATLSNASSVFGSLPSILITLAGVRVCVLDVGLRGVLGRADDVLTLAHAEPVLVVR